MGFIKWPQFYAAEAKKIKGGNFNDRKCINLIYNIPSLLGITKMSIEVVIDDFSLDEAEDSETASGEAIYTSEARGSDEAG